MTNIKLETPANSIIVKVKTKYIGNISNILKISAIEHGSSVDSVDLVNIMGEVVGLPRKIESQKVGYKGFSADEIKIGDTAIFSYNIIHDFKIEADGEQVYRNRFFYQNEEYFVADITKVFGVIKGEDIVMINGYAMLGEYKESQLIIPAALKKLKKASETFVMHIGLPKTNENKIDAKSEDIVYFNPMVAQKYQINGKRFTILTQNKIFGKKLED
jgi:co-chaperonin GroES (HSP10)